ncbi:hypothetical protein PAHAL_2G234000 [Panicum hallii]|uniref:Protein kinase domain-containing protein n=1 Tax=Panicum hallii TaxID=206008 RepID=A0A2S3GYW0_9POAL|nr:L-type lectin-domain containing receptor kinase S.4-like [Panicum hallii]PAN11997.1 hypothetical protein PAHAL_2G234000 [Panicum hallii]
MAAATSGLLAFLCLYCFFMLCIHAPCASSTSFSFNFSDTSKDPCANGLKCFGDAKFTSSVGSFSFSGSGVVVKVNTTASPLLLLLLVSLPGKGSQSACHPASSTDGNRMIPWAPLPLPLEQGIYGGVPRVGELVPSYSFGTNKSLDGGFFRYGSSLTLPNIQEPLNVNDDHLEKLWDCLLRHHVTPHISHHRCGCQAPIHFHSAIIDTDPYVRTGHQNDSSRREAFPIPIRSNRTRRHERPHGVILRGHRKLLQDHDSSVRSKRDLPRRRRRQVQLREERVVGTAATTRIAVGLALFGLLCTVAGLVLWCVRKKLEDEEPIIQQSELCPSSGPRRYSHRELAAATGRFAEEERIGRGGFGPVYRGFLADQDRRVAIKVMSQGSSTQAQGTREFQAEVKVMTRLRHRSIVQLLGWCDGPEALMLVYEFLPNASLDKHLHGPERLLTWPDRYKIALGVGSAILYLHTECEQCILHGDIKPANILLDQSCNPKLGDFGLARLVDHEADSRTTQVVAGTPGYMDPGFVSTQRPSAESDIFSFGVVLLEIACGRRPTTRPNGAPVLLNWVRDMYTRDSILAAADRRLDGEFDDQQMRRVLVAGLWCAHHDQSQRPSIAQAMDLLQREDAELPVLDPVMHSSPEAVRSLEEIAYGDFSAEDSVSENSSAHTAYHTSTDSSCLLE